MNSKKIITLASLAALAWACKPDPGCMDPAADNYDPNAKSSTDCVYSIPDTVDPAKTVSLEIEFRGVANGKEFNLNETYTNNDGFNFYYTAMRLYASNIRFASKGENKVDVKDVELVNYDTIKPSNPDIPTWDNVTESSINPSADIDQIYVGFGVDIEANEEYNPNKYPADHPLSTTYTGMGWDWARKYKFALIEGRVDSTGGGVFDRSFVYHTGLSALYRLAIVDLGQTYNFEAGKKYKIVLDIDMIQVFDGVKIETDEESFSHTLPNNPKQVELSSTIQTNLSRAISFNRVEEL